MDVDLATPGGTAHILRRFGIRPRKRWGQHFLVSRRVLDRILAASDLAPQDAVLDIGAGVGTLTVALARRAGRVIALEVDRTLLPPLRAAVAPCSNVQVVEGDVMTADLGALFGDAESRKVVANLPYNLASAVVTMLLERSLGLRRLVVTVQREVAERMAASPGGNDYGLLSVAVQYRADVSIVARVPPSAFVPPPEVDSAVVRLDVRPHPACAVRDERLFFQVVRASFAQRRKTVRNALAGGIPLTPADAGAACGLAGIAALRRGETLSLAEFAALTEAVASLSGSRRAAASGGE